MAEGERSRATKRAQELAKRMFRQYQLLVKEFTPDLGMETVSGSEFERRWAAMDMDERTAELLRRGNGDLRAGLQSVIADLGVINA